MNEPVSPQRRRPPGWRAARPAPEATAEDGRRDPGADAEPAGDPAFGRGETVERPAVRLPPDDRTRTMSTVESERYRADPVEDRLRLGGGAARRDDDLDDDPTDDLDDRADDLADEDDEAPADGHPVAVPLAGFFAGMVYVLVLPVLYVWLSNPDSIADVIGVDLVWLLAAVLVPVLLTAIPQTRTFGRYMLFGVGLSAVVVIGVAAIVLAVLIFLI